MDRDASLSPAMTPEQFENGYWYAVDLKRFARKLGVPQFSRLRKDELEDQIVFFLTHRRHRPPARRLLNPVGIRDSEGGLSLGTAVVNYTNDPVTKGFLESEAFRLDPGYRKKSGARYRLNRWREQQLEAGVSINYGHLVRRYVELSRVVGPFPQSRSGRYVNFLADYLSREEGATREGALAAWHELKELNVPKSYEAWSENHRKERESKS